MNLQEKRKPGLAVSAQKLLDTTVGTLRAQYKEHFAAGKIKLDS